MISSLSSYARINEFGFIESPYRKVKSGRVIDFVQIVNSGDSEFKAGEIVEKEKVEDANEELKRRRVVWAAALLLSFGVGRRPLRRSAGQRFAR